MPASLCRLNGKTYLDVSADALRIASERDGLDMVALCGKFESGLLLLDGACLDPAFFDLKTGLAGEVLLKLSSYRIRTALVTTPVRIGSGRFAEFVLETNRGNQFRVYTDRHAAEPWLTG